VLDGFCDCKFLKFSGLTDLHVWKPVTARRSASGTPRQHPVKWQSSKFTLNYYKYIWNLNEITHAIHQFKLHLLLIQPMWFDFKKALRWKQTMWLCEDSTPPNKHMTFIFQPARNRDIIHALLLKIFFCWHSKMSHKHHKWSFCSINSVIISPKCQFIWLVWSRKTRVPTWLQNI
jgi:hypothetical protein